MTATFVRECPWIGQSAGRAATYKLSKPLSTDGLQSWYIVVSSQPDPPRMPVTQAFLAGKHGDIKSWGDLVNNRGKLDLTHKETLKALGVTEFIDFPTAPLGHNE